MIYMHNGSRVFSSHCQAVHFIVLVKTHRLLVTEFFPRCNTTSKYTYSREAFLSQDFCRSDRATFLVSDGDDEPRTVRLQLVQLCVEFGQGTQHRFCNVTPFPNKLVRVPYIKHER